MVAVVAVVVVRAVHGGEVEVCDGGRGAGVRADVHQVAVAGEDGGEADGGRGRDVDCDERELDFVVYRKEHRTGGFAGVVEVGGRLGVVLRPVVMRSMRRRDEVTRPCCWYDDDHNATRSVKGCIGWWERIATGILRLFRK